MDGVHRKRNRSNRQSNLQSTKKQKPNPPLSKTALKSKSKSKSKSKLKYTQTQHRTRGQTSQAIQTIRKRFGERLVNNKSKIINNIRGRFLNKVCYSSGECLAFGREVKTIRAFFENFTTEAAFDLIEETTPQNRGENGTIEQIKYTKKVDNIEYNAFAIVKTPNSSSSDNLAYEYLVGKEFINEMMIYFPCFVETYGLFLDHPTTGFTIVKEEEDDFTEKNCKNSLYLTLIIQHLQNPRTFHSEFEKLVHSFDILYVLLQVYYPLSTINSKKYVFQNTGFTHYDLHSNNVLLYVPDENGYIEYHYHYADRNETINFKCKYLAKIIDYGRCYFYKDTEHNSVRIYDEVCKTKECNVDKVIGNGENCGFYKGFFSFKTTTQEDHKINSKINNISFDLKLINLIKQSLENAVFDSQDTALLNFQTLLKKVQFNTNPDCFGTDELPSDGKGNINNIHDALELLKNLALDPISKAQNDFKYDATKRKIGDMHVYNDGKECSFEPY